MDEPEGSGNEALGEEDATAVFSTTLVDFERPATLVGQQLDGRFLIEKNLTDDGGDIGGIGLVYLARDMKLMGKEVVVKILQEAALKHKDIVRKFLHEKEALIRLDHPGIVRILDSGTLSDGNPFMVMEYIEGHSLRKALKTSGKLSLDAAANVIESVMDALAAAHAKNILHRDIKPENIMLTPQEDGPDRVRLIDFGIARVGDSQLAPETEVPRAIGTILYIAPEQLIGRHDLTATADIYASAIVAYEMVTGQLPFKPKTHTDMYLLEKEGVKTQPRTLRPDLPPAAEKLLLSALDFEPENRPKNARAFGRELARALRNQGFEASGGESEGDLSDVITEVITKVDPKNFETTVDPKPNPFLKWAVIGALALAAIAVPTGYVMLKGIGVGNANNVNSNPGIDPPGSVDGGKTVPDPGPEHELSYFLTVQEMRNGKPFEAPYQTSGMEIFRSGDKFTLNFVPDADGFMYVFNEGKDEKGNTGYSILFPVPTVNGGSPKVTAGKKIGTDRNTFEAGTGTEIMWMIWTKEKRDDLEAIVRSAFASQGAVKDVSSITSLASLVEKYKAVKSEASKDSANQRTVLKTKGDVVVHRVELEHR